jgi:hypothetical protein
MSTKMCALPAPHHSDVQARVEESRDLRTNSLFFCGKWGVSGADNDERNHASCDSRAGLCTSGEKDRWINIGTGLTHRQACPCRT